jgi:hypothetical protein
MGKAGSGQSTLMKYILQDLRTQRHLEIWAGDADLIVASYYFWRAGTEMQNTKEGLLHTLLYEAFLVTPHKAFSF